MVAVKPTPEALALSAEDVAKGIFEGNEYFYTEFLNNEIRRGPVFYSSDSLFYVGGMDLIMDENTKNEHEYTDFDRYEFMYFTSGGMKLIDKDGNECEAQTEEMIFIPKGWTGTRIFTGDNLMSKFSFVYRSKEDLPDSLPMSKAFALNKEDLESGIYESAEFKFVEMLKSSGRGASVFKSLDGKFSIGGSHLRIEDTFEPVYDYVDFPRNELMYFTKGGIKLEDEAGNIVEANEGEFALIPKGYTGKRTFLGTEEIQKFSWVYQ